MTIIDNKHAFQGPVMSESHLLVNTMLLLRLLTSIMFKRDSEKQRQNNDRERETDRQIETEREKET